MSKKVVFNGIELSTSKDDVSTKSFFDFTGEVIDLLETELDNADENFNLNINTEFAYNKLPKLNVSVNGLTDQKTRGKIMKILERASNALIGRVAGTVNISLLIED